MQPDDRQRADALEQEAIKWRKSLLAAFRFAKEGAVRSLRLQRNLRIHFVAGLAVLWWNLCTRPEALLVTLSILTVSFVMAIELLNTALEHITDLATEGGFHQMAKWAKDAAAGAVLVSSLGAVAVAGLLLRDTWPWHFLLFSRQHWFGALESVIALMFLCAWGVLSVSGRR